MNSPGGQEHEAARLSLGAYVLGGLGPAQRGEVERHTATCPACQAELAGLATVPALLRRIDPLAAMSTLGTPAGRRGYGAAEPGSDPALLTRLINQVVAERARRRQQIKRLRMATTVSGLAAVALLAVTVSTSVMERPPPVSPAADIAMTPGDAGSASGRAGLEARAWGTAVSLELQRLPAGTSFVAWAIADDGRREQAATWGPTPTGAARLSGATAIPRAQLARLEVVTATGESVLTAAA